MDLRSVFISNGVGVAILLVLMYVSRTKVQRRHVEDRLYSFMVIGVMLACFMEAASYALDGKVFPGSRVLNYIANTYLFTVNLLLPFSMLVYIDLGLYGDPGRIWKKYKPQIIIGAIMLAVNIVNFFVPISYYISPQNVYERRPVSYVYYFVILYYAISAIVVTHRYEKRFGTRSFFKIELFLVPIIIGTSLQFMFYGLSLAWLSSAIGLVGLYMMQQNETAYIDPLTGVYNRQYLRHMLSSWEGRSYRFFGIMIDLDRFKIINDTYGHSEGDSALVAAADLLRSVCGDGSMAFRFAGDEFIILIRTDDAVEPEKKTDELLKAIEDFNRGSEKPYTIEVSYGLAAFDPEKDSVDSFMGEMDRKMYEMKREHHGDAGEDGADNCTAQNAERTDNGPGTGDRDNR